MPDRGRRVLSRIDAAAALRARTRMRALSFGASVIAGIATYLIFNPWLTGASRFVAAYDAAALTLLGFWWLGALRGDAEQTRARAALDDPGRNVIAIVVFVAVVVGLISAVAILGHGPKVHTAAERYTAYLLGFVAISAGWFLVHSVYTFRYAHLYWYGDPDDPTDCGGIRFPGDDPPSDMDFAYFAFTLGTSFAVSDPQVTESRVRREVIVHSIISFAYNSVIIGMVINLFAGIFSGTGDSTPAK